MPAETQTLDTFYKNKVINFIEVIHHLKNKQLHNLAQIFEKEVSELLKSC